MVFDAVLVFLSPNGVFVFSDAFLRRCIVVLVLSCEGVGREGAGIKGAGLEEAGLAGAGREGAGREGAEREGLLGEVMKPDRRLRSRSRRNILAVMEESEMMKRT